MKLSLRDLFWLILLAAVATMWWMDRSRLAAELVRYKLPGGQPNGSVVFLDGVQREREVLSAKIRKMEATVADEERAQQTDPFDPFK